MKYYRDSIKFQISSLRDTCTKTQDTCVFVPDTIWLLSRRALVVADSGHRFSLCIVAIQEYSEVGLYRVSEARFSGRPRCDTAGYFHSYGRCVWYAADSYHGSRSDCTAACGWTRKGPEWNRALQDRAAHSVDLATGFPRSRYWFPSACV